MVVGAKVGELTDGFWWFVCGILMSPLNVLHDEYLVFGPDP